ncbi:MAG: SPFH domain-containing protein [Succinivibrionaceae bacterium]|nr:SPFH domain-containing protein [Succinivibrionaceae bacterium]MEE1340168.1 SPFH domain-containing protein [Succinivibrionaceae bacterium]
MLSIVALVVGVVILLAIVIFFVNRYRRCQSDQILVIYGMVAGEKTSKCMHGGGAFVWPLIQDYTYLSLTPITISIPLTGALSSQNIRINVPSAFTIRISEEPGIMENAAVCLLGLDQDQIEDMAKNIIFGQLRLTVASLTIEEINKDRESFLDKIRKNVEPELNRIGLTLLNVNVTDITDDANYIASIGKKAAAEAVNQAKVDVATQDKLGSIGESEANKERDISVAQNKAEAEKGMKQAEADQRCYVAEQESNAISGENNAKAKIAKSNADLQVVEAQARQDAEVAQRKAEVEIQRAQYAAEKQRLNASEIAKQEIDKEKIIIDAQAVAEKARQEASGEADAILLKYQAEAKGTQALLEAKAEGYRRLVESAGNSADAATLLMIEKLEEIVGLQTQAIKNIKIDKVTVWDKGNSGDGKTATADFLSGMVQSLPPLHDVAKMAGLNLPNYLGTVAGVPEVKAPLAPKAEVKPEAKAQPKA